MKNVHVGVIGCGEWGQHIVRDLAALGCTVSVVATSKASRDRAISNGASSLFGTAEELVGVEGIVVATPTSLHAASIRSVSALNVPIFCEKALTDDPAEASALAAAFGDRLFVMDKWRYHPGVEMLRDIARSGRIGAIQALRLRRMGWSNPHDDVDAAWILLPHDLSIAREILGKVPDIQSAIGFATDGEVRTAWVHGNVDDVAVASEMSTESEVRERSIVLYGTEGTAALNDPLADHVSIRPLSVPDGDRPGHEEVPISTEFPLLRELRSFVEHLNGGAPPRSSAADGAATVARIAQIRHMIDIRTANG